MTDNELDISDLLEKQLFETLTDSERERLDRWRTLAPGNEALFQQVTDPEHTFSAVSGFFQADLDNIRQKVIQLAPALLLGDEPDVVPAHRVHFLKTAWFRYAAILLLLAGVVTYLYTVIGPRPQQIVHHNVPDPIEPGGYKAVLTLADGSTVVLDSNHTGSIANQGNTRIVKRDAGSLTYEARSGSSSRVLFNTVTTPVGGMYQISLPDGTRVWLNAASSITFPTAFNSTRRNVKITGEVYFEVASDARKSFSVSVDNMEIQVLATRFNVNAYADEPSVAATLLEGAVRIEAGGHLQNLRPGQQLFYSPEWPKFKVLPANVDEVMAWKEGFFSFNNADIRTVMRQLGRWYDVTIRYERDIPTRGFKGQIGRDLNLSDVIALLKESDVNVKLQGRTLIVMP